jgi:hypothetical protein
VPGGIRSSLIPSTVFTCMQKQLEMNGYRPSDLHIETIISRIASYVKQTIFELSMLIRKEWVLFLGKIKEIEN